MFRSVVLALLTVMWLAAAPAAHADSVCDPDGVQASGSIYRICMPTSGYNGILVVWAHGFQDAGTPVSIPEDHLCVAGFCIPEIANELGFGFATNSYSKTGLAVLQGQADILDLVNIFARQKGKPSKVYLVGASEGGLITVLNLEQHPGVFSAGLAVCGPIGDFPYQINYFGDARVTFEYFFPGLIPGDPLAPDPGLVRIWPEFYERTVRPYLFDPSRRPLLDQWTKVAQLPFDPADYVSTLELSVRDVLNYSVVNVNDAVATLGGSPFDNRLRWYSGSSNDLDLNFTVLRVAASPVASREMTRYNASGSLSRPLITMHTQKDQQVPYFHEQLYDLKAFFAGSLLTRHLNIPIDRYGHCNFTREEALFAFAVTLLYDGILDLVSGTASFLSPQELSRFERRAQEVGLRTTRRGRKLKFKLKPGAVR